LPNRYLRSEILDSNRVDALSESAEIFYRRLMSVVDDYGRYEADWRVLRAKLYPRRVDSITREQIEAWLTECARVIEGEDEPLVSVYQVGRKKYLQINNFGQRIRSESRFPEPPARERETVLQADVRTPRTSVARATSSSSLSSSNSNSHFPEGGAGGNQPDRRESQEAIARQAFDTVLAKYPQAGRTRIEAAWQIFREVFAEACDEPDEGPDEVLAEMLEGLERWLRSEQWQAGKVHSLKNFFAEKLWREQPLAAADAKRLQPVRRSKTAWLEARMAELQNRPPPHTPQAASGNGCEQKPAGREH
jgi:hypothetical protein